MLDWYSLMFFVVRVVRSFSWGRENMWFQVFKSIPLQRCKRWHEKALYLIISMSSSPLGCDFVTSLLIDCERCKTPWQREAVQWHWLSLRKGQKAFKATHENQLEVNKHYCSMLMGLSQPRFQAILMKKNTLAQGLDFWVEFWNCFEHELSFIALFALFTLYCICLSPHKWSWFSHGGNCQLRM